MVVAGAVAVAVVVTVAEGRMNEETSWLHASLNSSHRSSGIFRTRARNQSMYAALSSLRSSCNDCLRLSDWRGRFKNWMRASSSFWVRFFLFREEVVDPASLAPQGGPSSGAVSPESSRPPSSSSSSWDASVPGMPVSRV